jgi:hypothetical protein
MSEKTDEKNIVAIGFINGASMIGTLWKDEKGAPFLDDVFFINLIRNPESRERNFVFKPVLPLTQRQRLDEKAFLALMGTDSVLSLYTPATSVMAAYENFIENEELVGKVIYDHLYECGPSKEFVDSLFKDMPKPKPREEGGVIKGLFGPTFRNICDDEEGQS